MDGDIFSKGASEKGWCARVACLFFDICMCFKENGASDL